jgi:hypothetical protein
MQVIWDYPVLVAVNGFGEGAVVMSWALEKWVVRLCWMKMEKGQAAVVAGKEVGQGKMDGGPHAGKKEGSRLGWFGNLADIEFFTFQIFYRLQTHLSSNQI